MTIQIKATEQYFPVVLFIMLYNVVLTFESVGGILKCDHSKQCFSVVLIIFRLFIKTNFRDFCPVLTYTSFGSKIVLMSPTAFGVPGDGVTASISGVDEGATAVVVC